MERINSSEFGLEELRRYPVWTWYSDMYSNEDTLTPVPMTIDALADADSLLIHAMFLTGAGERLEGLVIYHLGSEEVFAIKIFSDGERFTFNKYAPEFSAEQLQKYAQYSGDNQETILPFHYEVVPENLAVEPGEFSF